MYGHRLLKNQFNFCL